MEYELKSWQQETFEYNIVHPYCINALGCGLGKTLESLHTAFSLDMKPLVIVPTYLRDNWEREIKQFFPGKVITKITKAKDIYPVWDSDIVLVSYGMVHKADALFKWADMSIFDEAHNLKNMTAKRTEACHRLIFEHAHKRCLLLTGTPVQNRVEELYSLMAICYYNPKFQEPPFLIKFPSYVDFAEYFSYRKEYTIRVGRALRTVVKYEGVRRVDELKKWLKGIYIRFDSSILGLQEPIRKPVLIKDKTDPRLWDAFTNFNKENSSTSPDIKAKVALEKVPFTVEYCRNLLEEVDSVVIFTDHVESCIALAKALNATPIHGSVRPEDRTRVANNFKSGKTKILVATIGSFSTGNNLVESHNMVINDPPWVPGELEQAEFRINRIGQTKTPMYHYIQGSIQDAYIYNTLREKDEVIEAVVK
jgi:SNF2 family DNA or RNA helicase